MTPAERDAFSMGVAFSAGFLMDVAARIRANAKGCPVALSNAEAVEIAATQLRPRDEPTGLEFRGG